MVLQFAVLVPGLLEDLFFKGCTLNKKAYNLKCRKSLFNQWSDVRFSGLRIDGDGASTGNVAQLVGFVLDVNGGSIGTVVCVGTSLHQNNVLAIISGLELSVFHDSDAVLRLEASELQEK